jgi:hypothetical protein
MTNMINIIRRILVRLNGLDDRVGSSVSDTGLENEFKKEAVKPSDDLGEGEGGISVPEVGISSARFII